MNAPRGSVAQRLPGASTRATDPAGVDRPVADRRLGWALAAVAGLVVLLQFAVVDLGRPISWDEAIYLSQVRPDVDALFFSVQRTRGIVAIVAPVAAWSDSVFAVRVWLVLLSGVGLWVAFHPWIRRVGAAAPVAAAGYGTTWFVLVSASEVYPNAMAALAAAAVVGWFLRAVGEDGGRREHVALAVSVAVLTVIRPTEAVFVCAGLVPALVGLRLVRGRPVVLAMLGGGALGLLPFLAESVARWDGVRARLEAMVSITTGVEAAAPLWRQYVALLDGPLQGPLAQPEVPLFGVAWLAAAAALLGAGWVTLGRRHQLRVAVALTGAVLALLLPYLLTNPYSYLRFLLPSWAVACGLAAVGVVGVVQWLASRPGGVRIPGVAVIIVLVAGWLTAQAVLAAASSARLADVRASSVAVGEFVAAQAAGQPCAVSAEYGFPQVAFVSGCDGDRIVPGEGDVPFADAAADVRVYAAVKNNIADDSPLASWEAVDVPAQDAEGWTLYIRPDR